MNSNDKGPRPYHDLNHAGMRAWAELAPGLDGAAWYRPAGNLELATSASGRAELAARVERLASWGYPARLIDAAEAAELEPALLPPGPDAAAAWFPGEAYLLTEPLIERLVARCRGPRRHRADRRAGPRDRPGRRPADQVRTAAGAGARGGRDGLLRRALDPELAALAGAPGTVPLVAWDTPGSPAPELVVRVGPVTPEGPVP